jgi:hypothetical protein
MGSDYKFQGCIYLPINKESAVAASKEDIYFKDKYLNKGTIDNGKLTLHSTDGEYMKINAQYIWQYLGQRGWSVNAVAALLGNIHDESTFSPGKWQQPGKNSKYVETYGSYVSPMQKDAAGDLYIDWDIVKQLNNYYKGDLGYGLVQWTNYSKYTKWCDAHNPALTYWDIDSQLKRIEAELEKSTGATVEPDLKDAQWINPKKYGFDLTFKEFTTSKQDVEWLVKAFIHGYERPGNPVYADRVAYGKFWYDYLKTLPAAFGSTGLEASNFRADNISSTYSEFSAIIKNCTKAKYKLFKGTDSKGELVKSELIFDLSSDNDNKAKKENKNNSENSDFLTFTIDGLVPNTLYAVELYLEGNKEDDFVSLEINFKSLQSYPQNVKDISLLVLNEAFPKGDFIISFKKPESWGYWENNSHGYEVALFVNNTKSTIETKNLSSFSLSYFFKNAHNKFKLGDNIQVGIRTWVEDDSENKVYSSDFYEMSNPICLLKKPVIAYLNV